MKFNFKIQQYQTDAVDAVVNVFAGQPYSSGVSYIRDTGTLNQKPQQLSFLALADNPEQMELEDLLRDSGYKNEVVALSDNQLLQNIHTLQSQNNIKLSPELVNDMGRCSLDIEMETGTGKTYVYIKTMFELNKKYGWSKFIVVVPSIAIREGVKKSFEITTDHFMEYYGKKARFFVYILQGIRADKLYMFKNNPEEFISKVIRLINEQKATMIVEHISYNTIEGEYDSSIFTAEKATQSFDKAFLAKKAIQDYVFTDGSAEKSIERKFAEDLDAAEEVCVYAKLPRTFQIPTPVGNYSPDWAIAFYAGTVKHIFFVAETKGTMETLELRPIEQAKISCAKKLFNEMSTSHVVYHDVDSYQSLLNIMNSI